MTASPAASLIVQRPDPQILVLRMEREHKRIAIDRNLTIAVEAGLDELEGDPELRAASSPVRPNRQDSEVSQTPLSGRGTGPARRPQRRGRRIVMTRDEIGGYLAGELTCRVATNRSQGPHDVPLWFHWDGRDFWLYSPVNSQRWYNLQRDPRVAIVVGSGVDWSELRGVQVQAGPSGRPIYRVPASQPIPNCWPWGRVSSGSTVR